MLLHVRWHGFVLVVVRAGLVQILSIDPQNTNSCPADWQLTTEGSGNQVCVRSGFPSSSVLIDSYAAMVAENNIKGRRIFDRITGTGQIYQKGSTDAFETGTRDVSSIDSSPWVNQGDQSCKRQTFMLPKAAPVFSISPPFASF